MIRKSHAESGSRQTASSASQSSISVLSAEKPRLVRGFANFLRLGAPEKLRFGRKQLTYARFSLSRIEPVAYGSDLGRWKLLRVVSRLKRLAHLRRNDMELAVRLGAGILGPVPTRYPFGNDRCSRIFFVRGHRRSLDSAVSS